jgi:hypothetical protein
MPIRVSRGLHLLVILFFVPAVCCLAGAAQRDSSPVAAGGGNAYPDASAFAAELQQIGNAIEKVKTDPAGLAAVRKKLPAYWEVTTGEGHYTLTAEPIRVLLHQAEIEKKPESIATKAKEASGWALDVANQLKAYAVAQGQKEGSARASLEKILSRREFASVHGPTKWDLLRQRIDRWIEDLLIRLFSGIGRHPMGAKVLLWSIVIAVVVWLAVTLFRYWSRRAVLEELQAPESATFTRTWQEWIQIAREAATRGDFREAVHSAYWAGISYLEDGGVVRKDRTRTPREYVRLVSTSTQFVDSGRRMREALSALTAVLEQVWYGRRPASQQDFADAIRNIEALGCQLQ